LKPKKNRSNYFTNGGFPLMTIFHNRAHFCSKKCAFLNESGQIVEDYT
jgi:hypothetical protein